MSRIIKNSLLCLLTLLPSQVSAQLQRYEYWFDDDYAGKTPVQLSGSEAEINTEIPTDGLASGIHTLHFRVKQEGVKYSSITSKVFFKSAGQIDQLQYWFDDDFEHAKTTAGTIGDSETTFAGNLDLSDVQEGYHRLYYRGISGSQQAGTAISMAPVMVKSRYNMEGKELKVVQYSVSVDNEAPVTYDVLNPKEEITQPYTLDARQLTEGQHTLTTHFWNSAGAGVTDNYIFTKSKPDPPTLTLTAQEKEGVVTLAVNTIPNGLTYRLFRSNAPLYRGHDAYPSQITFQDTPEEGYYHYRATCSYNDAEGNPQTIESEPVTVQVSMNANEIGDYGYLFVEPKYGFTPGSVFIEGAPYGLYDFDGQFFQTGKVPVGQNVTITIYDDRIDYKEQTVTVRKGKNHIIIDGTPKDGVQIDPADCDFVFDSDMEWVKGEYMKFKIKNTTTHSWSGMVRMRAVNRRYETTSLIEAILESEFLGETKNMYIGLAPSIKNLAPNRSIEVTIPLNSFLVDEDEYYNLYFETIESTDNKVKRIAINYQKDYSVTSNPWNRLIEKTHNSYQSIGEIAIEMANLSIALLSKVDGVNKRLGDLNKFTKAVNTERERRKADQNFAESLDITLYSFEELQVMIDNHYKNLENGNATDNIDDKKLKTLAEIISRVLAKDAVGLEIMKEFRNTVQEKVNDNIGGLLGISGKITGTWSKITEYIKDVKEIESFSYMDPHKKFFYCTRLMLHALSSSNPYAKAIKLYLDISEKIVDTALDNETYKYEHEEAFLIANNQQNNDDFYHYKNKQNVNFRIIVNKPLVKNYGHFTSFDFSNDVSQIKSLKIMVSNNTNEAAVDTMVCHALGDTGGFYLIQDRYIDNGGIFDSNGMILNPNVPLTKLWMEIVWKNGRTSVIPLKEGNGVKFTTVYGPTYTVTFNSGSNRMENIADIINLVE